MKVMRKEIKTVLIVDDSTPTIGNIIPVLGELEHISFVVHAGNYKEGLEVLSRLTRDRVLLEIHQPDNDAMELLRLIRERKTEIAILMISNRPNRSYNDLCKRLGTLQFPDKPQTIGTVPIPLSAACQ
jgi:DNA-binding NarL/FixJ family response regulator